MPDPLRKRAWIFTLTGAAIWGLLWIAPLPGDALPIPRFLMLAMLVIVPIGLLLAQNPNREGKHSLLYRILHWAQLPAAIIAAGSFYVPEGVTAALLAGPWMLFCIGVAVFGLTRFLPRGFGGFPETCIDVATLYLPVGGGWLILSRLGIPVMDFSPAIIALTAIHFHYAGFAAPIFAGMVGRYVAATKPGLSRVFATASIGVITGIALVAVGITLSPLIEVAAALVLAFSLVGVAMVGLGTLYTFDRLEPRILIPVSALALILGMMFAAVYALGEFTGAGWLVIPWMVQYHGVANAAGLLLGLIGWGIINPKPAISHPSSE